jgi:hypothetical protein
LDLPVGAIISHTPPGVTFVPDTINRFSSCARGASLLFALLCSSTLSANDTGAATPSPYAGEQDRAIKSLSENDITELRRGGGWGLARAAELNGYPGPAHLLELREAIPLTPEQVDRIEGIYRDMRIAAQAGGNRLIAAEQALDQAFAQQTVNPDSLRALVADVEAARAALRIVHLEAHLQARPVLSEQQVRRYDELRGYGDDSCARAPEGHDAALWRRHHGCT